MGPRRRLIKVGEHHAIWAAEHRVEGSELRILELMAIGFAYSSLYILLKSTAFLAKLDDDKVREAVQQHPTRFGKRLELGRDLERDPKTGEIYLVGAAAGRGAR